MNLNRIKLGFVSGIFIMSMSADLCAEVLSLKTEKVAGQSITSVLDANTAVEVNASPSPDWFVQSKGAIVTSNTDTLVLSVWFNNQAQLQRFDGATNALAVPSGMRVEHLGFTSSVNQIVALARSDIDDQVYQLKFNASTGGLISFVGMGADCCIWEGLASAYNPTAQQFHVVGRRTAGSAAQLLSFNFISGNLQTRDFSAPESILALAINPSNAGLFALTQDPSTQLTELNQITLGGVATFTPIGAPSSNCCFIGTGNALIDPASNQMFAIARELDLSGIGPPRMAGWNLTSGVNTFFANQSPFGIISNDQVLFDAMFRDGFE